MTMEFDTQPTVSEPSRSLTGRRVVAGVAAAMLVAAAGGVGFGIGRNVDRGDQIDTAASAADASPPPVTEPPAPATIPAVPMPVATDAPAQTVPSSGESVADVNADDPASSEAIVSSGGYGYSVFGNQEMDLLFERTTDAGIDVRAQLGALWDNDGFGGEEFGGWRPPAWCYESGQVRIAMTGDDVIDVGGVGWFSEPYEGRAVSWLTMGGVDGSPHRIVFVQAPAGTSLVTAAFGDGATDAIEPQNGVAVLVVPGAPDSIVHDEGDDFGGWVEELPDFTVTFAGAPSGDLTVAHDQVGTWNDPDFAASCSPPPPALPDAGDQPVDPEAAEAEIVAAMDQLYGSQDESGELSSSLDLLDDATGVAEAREQIRAGGFENEASSARTIVEELVFTTSTEAWFRYRIETDGIGLNERYGIAVQVDGVWLITRGTLCQDLSMAGGSCGDDVNIVIRPPGYEYEAVIDEGFIVD